MARLAGLVGWDCVGIGRTGCNTGVSVVMEGSGFADLAGSRSCSCAAVTKRIAGDAGISCEVEELLGSASLLAVRSESKPSVGWTGCAFVGVSRHRAFSTFWVT